MAKRIAGMRGEEVLLNISVREPRKTPKAKTERPYEKEWLLIKPLEDQNAVR
jgi:hypothetical protein